MEEIMFIFSIILLISVFSTKISKKFNIPTLIIFLLIGMFFGSEGVGKIYFDNADLAYLIATTALCFILFYGGLETRFNEIRPVLKEGIALSVLGVLFNALLFAIPIYYLTKLNFTTALLASACVASTDAAAVFSLLEFNKIKLKYRLRNVLELESGSNDPMAYVLVLIFISLANSANETSIYYILFFVRQMVLGLVFGIAFGYAAKFFLRRLKLNIAELYSIVLVSLLLLTFSVTNMASGNGFLAIYILGIILRSKKYLFKNSTLKFFSVISWFMQIALFISLGLLVFPSKLMSFAWCGVALSLVLMFVVRPLSVFASLHFVNRKLTWKPKLYISWGGLKGAVPIVFAIFAKTANVPHSDTIFNLIFCIVIVSVLIQGMTLPFAAQILKLNASDELPVKESSDAEELEYFEDQVIEVTITANSKFIEKKICELGLPDGVMIVLIKREEAYIHPMGQTVIEEGDRVIVMCHSKKDFFDYLEKESVFA